MQLNFARAPARLISGFEHRTLFTQQNRDQQPACGLELKIKLRVPAFLVLGKDNFIRPPSPTSIFVSQDLPCLVEEQICLVVGGEKQTGCSTLCLPLISCLFPEDRVQPPLLRLDFSLGRSLGGRLGTELGIWHRKWELTPTELRFWGRGVPGPDHRWV